MLPVHIPALHSRYQPFNTASSASVNMARGTLPACGARPSGHACLQAKRVLLVEDNLINQAVAKKMLTSLGMSCDVASNGADAVHDVLTKHHGAGVPFHIILMDMSMPVMGGVEATQVLAPSPRPLSWHCC